MDDAQVEGVNRGFAFIEFGTHEDALEAFRKLQQPDAIFGTDRSAKVRWAQPLYEPDEDTMSQVSSWHDLFMIFVLPAVGGPSFSMGVFSADLMFSGTCWNQIKRGR